MQYGVGRPEIVSACILHLCRWCSGSFFHEFADIRLVSFLCYVQEIFLILFYLVCMLLSFVIISRLNYELSAILLLLSSGLNNERKWYHRYKVVPNVLVHLGIT